MKKLALLIVLAFTSLAAYAQQPSVADIEAAKRDRLMDMLAAKSGGNGNNQVTDLQPEQDCPGAITVCQSLYIQPNSYTGPGHLLSEIDNTQSCLGAGELNGVWYKIMVTNNGSLAFTITPNAVSDDYDWAVFNLTNSSCSDIYTNPALEVSCNFSGSTFPTAATGANGAGNAQDEATIPVYSGEVYYIYISNFSSTQSGYTLDFSQSTINLGACSHIYGSIYIDTNNNCQLNPNDEPLAGQIVYMLPGPHYGISDANGLYHIGIPTGQTGTYQVYTQPLTPAVEQSCPLNPSYLVVQVNNTDSLYPGNNFAYLPNNNIQCPALYVSNMSPVIRVCCDNTRHIQVCNQGSGISQNAQLELTYMDNYIVPSNFRVNGLTAPVTQNGNVYTVTLPVLNIGQCIDVTVEETVADPDYVGQTTCVLAHALPDYNCGDMGGWDLSNVELFASCNGDTTISFTLHNEGAGDMLTPQTYTIYNGLNVAQTATYQLQAGQSITYTLPANGDLFVMQAHQTNDNPYSEIISGYIENCGNDGNTITATIDMYYTDYGSLSNDMDCNTIVNSYDPNDKSASPTGVGPQHFIGATDEIEYKIRFQNTGNAFADRVVLVDTLDAHLDPATIRLGASTHPYSTELTEGGILTFTFNNINLPPLQQDEAGSMGAVTFSVKQRWGLPINYSIHNTAYIYFDLNPAIVTNTVFHNVKDNTTTITESTAGNILAELYPNPAGNSFTIKVDALKAGQGYNMQLFTSIGSLVREVSNIKSAENTVDISGLATGLYYYRILTTDGKTAAGRFVKE